LEFYFIQQKIINNYFLWSFGFNWRLFPTFYSELQFDEYNESQHPKLLKAMIERNQKLTMGLLSPLSRHFYLLDDIDGDHMVSTRLWNYVSSRNTNPHVALIALEWEITRNEKVVVIGPDTSLANEIAYLKAPYLINQCKIFPESLAIKIEGWGFRRPMENKLDRYFRQLVETGIYCRSRIIAVENENYRTILKRLNGSRLVMEENKKGLLSMRVQPVKLTGSHQTIFELWGLLLLSAFCWLMGEIGFQNTLKLRFNWYFRFTQPVLQELRKCTRKLIALYSSTKVKCSTNCCLE